MSKLLSFEVDHLPDYMERWILRVFNPFTSKELGQIRLHHFIQSDHDRHLHDHMWDFTTVLLTGHYWEIVPADSPKYIHYNKTLLRKRFSIIHHAAEDAHRVVIDKPVWTLVLAGPHKREWGFYNEHGWVHWRDYFGLPSNSVV